jgi:hypothetical protein
MNEKLTQFPLLWSHDLKARVKRFRFANEMESTAEAVRFLLEHALKDLENKGKKKGKTS